MLKKFASLIARHTAISRKHLTPEIALRLVTPSCPLWSAPAQDSPFQDPFWAFYWPGGQATARYILDNKHLFRDRDILDLGCGCGAGSIAAAMAGARRVVANDIDEIAIQASKINAYLNSVNIETSTENLIGSELEEFDMVLIGDMFYDEEFSNILFEWLRRLSRAGKTVIIGDPGRHGLTTNRRQQLTLLATYKLPSQARLENNGFLDTSLWRVNVG